MRNGMGTLLKSPATSGGPTFAYFLPVALCSGQSRRRALYGTWCGRLIIIWNDGGSGHRI